MTITSNISLLAQSQLQSSRLNDLHSTLDDLQRQITTQKKFDNFSGFGTDAINLQRLHTTKTMTDSYLHNIDAAISRMTLMNQDMTKLSSIGSDVIHAMGTSDVTNMQSLNQFAQQSLQFVQDILNEQSDGQYLFAGSDNTNQPFIDSSTLNSNFANQVNTWLANAAPNANATLFNTTDGFTTSQLGLSSGLAASGTVTAHIDQNVDLDYTVKADNPGFQNLIRSLTFLAHLKAPDPAAGDVATKAQFDAVLDHIHDTLTSSIQEINNTDQQLVGKFNLAKDVQDNHQSDQALLTTQIDTLENTDPNTAIIQMQSLQTQMTASYQITKIVSQMSLVNFI
jgi:flagellin-like hook-associated protein FlgL